ncbi:hypothetical protein TA3x_005443 [Tundrisphaera sp. TA3]|uniref:hypothetical protein n=1 Tax=Tundrisphaera sp. TA3 TaxID=3435775 RepID=UPI003EBA3CA9
MMRTFTIGAGDDRKSVTLEVQGSWLRVTKDRPDGTQKVEMKEFEGEANARAASKDAARQLIAHGYKEANAAPATPRAAEAPARSKSKSRPKAAAKSPGLPAGLDLGFLADDDEAPEGPEAMPLGRLAPPPAAAEARPKKKKAGRKKKRNQAQPGQGGDLDKRVIAGIAAFGLACLAVVGFLGYKAFLEPPSIVGNWEGSRTEHEIGKSLTNTQYVLILDGQGRASMAIDDGPATSGTYAYRKGRLNLSLKDEEGRTSEVQYRTALGGATLDLFDPASGKKLVQLIRFHKAPVVGGGKPTPEAPRDLANAPADKAADEKLASVPFGSKDGAFALRHPPGWEAETGGRSDNLYSWAKLTKGSFRIRIYADAAGSLMAGPNPHEQFEEGSELAPVHGAHERYKKDAAELYKDYAESEPAAFKGSTLGEGRIATFTATGDGVFGAKLRGIRVTLLTNDRRLSVFCEAPTKQFDQMLPTFLATCRSLSR